VWNWFDPKGAFDNDYIFAAFVGRGALQWKDDSFDVMVEAQNSSLVSLPDKASAPAPQGSLGLGAVYFAHNRREDEVERRCPRASARCSYSAQNQRGRDRGAPHAAEIRAPVGRSFRGEVSTA